MEQKPVWVDTGTPGGLKPEHAPVLVLPEMRFWLRIDEELVGSRDQMGIYAHPSAVNDMLTEYGIRGLEDRKLARYLIRKLGEGRAEAESEDR